MLINLSEEVDKLRASCGSRSLIELTIVDGELRMTFFAYNYQGKQFATCTQASITEIDNSYIDTFKGRVDDCQKIMKESILNDNPDDQ